jgi:protein-S-isoprenylcysteine O-methyltransferase Ste14
VTESEKDAAAVRLAPPLVYLLAVIAGVLLQYLVYPLRAALPGGLRITATVVLAALGLALMLGAFRHFQRTGQDPAPWTPTPEMIASGVYERTRNPMYVSMTLLLASIGIGAANGWMLLSIPLVVLVIQQTAIRHEEAYLERKFGEPYLAYKRRVRRWI